MKANFAQAHLKMAAVREVFERSSRDQSHVAAYWSEGPNVRLGAQFKCQIATQIACEITETAPSDFYHAIVVQHEATGRSGIPQRRGGLASVGKNGAKLYDYDHRTYYGWLTGHGTITPKKQDLVNCTELVLRTADSLLAGKLKSGKTLQGLLTNYVGTARQAFADSLDLLQDYGNVRDWRLVEAQIHSPMPIAANLRPALGSSNFEDCFGNVCDVLRVKRSVQVTGPHYAGKSTLLRRFVTQYAETGLQIESGSYLTICALSLYEASAFDAIRYIASFYGQLLGIPATGRTASELVAEIAHFARQVPAVFVIAGLDAIDRDEIVRAIHQDLLGETVSRILQGHEDTRVLVSTSAAPAPSRSRSPSRLRTLAFDHTEDLAERGIPPGNYEYHTLMECAKILGSSERGWPPAEFAAAFSPYLVDRADLRRREIAPGRIGELGQLIAGVMLDESERFCLGLVALTHDGLRASTLKAVFTALKAHLPETLRPVDPLQVLDAMPDAVVRHPAGNSDEGCYRIEHALRDSLLQNWLECAPAQFRLGAWGIARAAAVDARRLRTRFGLDVSAGRDVQVLVRLLASVDVTAMSSQPVRRTLPEDCVLPGLDDGQAAMPPSADVLEFAYRALFARDFARTTGQGRYRLDDAQLRLEAVFPFFNNREPWLERAATLGSNHWQLRPQSSPLLHLGLTEKLHILAYAASAAARRNSRELITFFARLAEAAAAGNTLTAQQYRYLARIQRYELDLGILLGRNPDAPSVRRPGEKRDGLRGVHDRVRKLLHAVPPGIADNRFVRRESFILRAREAEVLHLMGEHIAAYRCFLGIVRDANAGATDLADYDVLSGRSRRMYTRLLVELARSKLVQSFRYKDKLVLPVIASDRPPPDQLLRAERQVRENLRALSLGSVNDWIGVKIDQARIAALRLQYAEALELLDEAHGLVSAPGASLDVLLEYMTVRGRTLSDAAAFTMTAGARSPHKAGADEAELRRLSLYVELDDTAYPESDWRRAGAVARALATRAEESLRVLRDHVALADTVRTRHAVFADYLEVWLSVVRSRERVASDDPAKVAGAVRRQLLNAAEKFEQVIRRMVDMEYLLSHREVRLLARSLDAVGISLSIPEALPDRRTRSLRSRTYQE